MSTSPVPTLTQYPNLTLTDAALSRLAEVRAMLRQLHTDRHPSADDIDTEFADRLRYLDAYGGTVSEADQRRRFLVTLSADRAPFCFGITWSILRASTGAYDPWMSGGLIWHGGGDPGTVAIVPMWWGIHT